MKAEVKHRKKRGRVSEGSSTDEEDETKKKKKEERQERKERDQLPSKKSYAPESCRRCRGYPDHGEETAVCRGCSRDRYDEP